MYMLRIEHPVPSYERWKNAFDSDPVDQDVFRRPALSGVTTGG